MNPIVASEIYTNRFDFLGEKIFYNWSVSTQTKLRKIKKKSFEWYLSCPSIYSADHTEDCLENSSWEDKVLKKIGGGGGGCKGRRKAMAAADFWDDCRCHKTCTVVLEEVKQTKKWNPTLYKSLVMDWEIRENIVKITCIVHVRQAVWCHLIL